MSCVTRAFRYSLVNCVRVPGTYSLCACLRIVTSCGCALNFVNYSCMCHTVRLLYLTDVMTIYVLTMESVTEPSIDLILTSDCTGTTEHRIRITRHLRHLRCLCSHTLYRDPLANKLLLLQPRPATLLLIYCHSRPSSPLLSYESTTTHVHPAHYSAKNLLQQSTMQSLKWSFLNPSFKGPLLCPEVGVVLMIRLLDYCWLVLVQYQ